MKRPEILAPAGSLESMRAAVAAGCDAVYVGGGRFGARAYADNLSDEELIESIAFCHLRGVKIYLTVNTLLKEEERSRELYSYLLPFYRAGLDAVIVQDVGVMDFVGKYFPGLDIHASTQMALTMGRGADRLKNCHVSRIVPARELSLEELKQMRRETSLELEVFVHGALCYSYSGQCLFSSMQGGRSGNRGRCAQPCRMPCQCGDGAGGEYLLSPRELCNLPLLGQLIEAGVDSLKIEGRMRRPEYTALATATYRKYVDLFCSLGKEGYREYLLGHSREWEEDLRCLAELYNREGFTWGYLEGQAGNVESRRPGKRGEMLSVKRPGHWGVRVGEVFSVGQREVTYRTEKKVFPQDVVEFRASCGEKRYEYTLGQGAEPGQNVTAHYQRGCQISPGDGVYRTRHGVLLEKLHQDYLEREVQVPIWGIFSAAVGKPAALTVQLGDCVVCCEDQVCQRAERQPIPGEKVERALRQTGGSPFTFEKLTVELEDQVFLSMGAVKRLRRRALEELEHRMAARYFREEGQTAFSEEEDGAGASRRDRPEKAVGAAIASRNASGKPPDVAVSVMNAAQLEAVLGRSEVGRVYLCTEELPPEQMMSAHRRIVEAGKAPCLAMPRIFRRGAWSLWEGFCGGDTDFPGLPWEAYLVRNWESMQFLREKLQAPEERMVLDYHMYIMNEGSYAFWRREGVEEVTLPLELTGRELAQFSFLDRCELLVYGRLPVMVTAQCMRANLDGCREKTGEDVSFAHRKSRRFFSRNYCRYCYNVIYQEEPLALGREQWESLPVRRIRYDFVTESPGEIREALAGRCRGATHMGHWMLGVE